MLKWIKSKTRYTPSDNVTTKQHDEPKPVEITTVRPLTSDNHIAGNSTVESVKLTSPLPTKRDKATQTDDHLIHQTLPTLASNSRPNYSQLIEPAREKSTQLIDTTDCSPLEETDSEPLTINTSTGERNDLNNTSSTKNFKSAYNKSFSLGHLQRLNTHKRVSIPNSDDDEEYSPWKVPPGIFKYHSQPASSLTVQRSLGHPVEEDLELKAEIILGQTLRTQFHDFMINKWVNAVDLGYREVHGQQTNLRCIKLWVKQKMNERDIPRNVLIEKMIDGCPIDKVVGSGHILGAEESWLDYCRKRRRKKMYKSKAKEIVSCMVMTPSLGINIGDSIGQSKDQCVLGTVGLLLECNDTIGILTAGHIGGHIGTKLVSPARREGKLNETRVVAMTTISAITEEVNCAFARLNGLVARGNHGITGTCRARVGDLVRYIGAGHEGKTQLACVKSIDWKGEIDGMIWSEQIQLSMPALPGDAGAVLIKEDTNEVIGMIVANASKHGIANHIDYILRALDSVPVLPSL